MVASISDIRQLGARNGSLYAVSSIGALVGSPIAGAISTTSLSNLIIFCGVLILAGTVAAILSRIKITGFKFLVKA